MKASRLLLTLLVVAALSLGTALAGGNSTTLPNGANLAVSIDDPETCTELAIPAGQATLDVQVSGTASVGLGEPDATLVYVIDVSYSTRTSSGGDCGGDINGDGSSNEVLDCECAAVLGLNQAAVTGGSVDEVGVVVFGENGASADMTPAGGDQLITAPDADTYLQTVVTSVYSESTDGTPAGVAEYTNKNVGGDGTDYAAALAAVLPVVQASTNGTNIVVFMSDGLSNQGGADFASNLAAVAATGATVYTFAVGTGSSCTGGTDGTLAEIASATGGTCTQVTDPAQLPEILPDLVSTTLNSLEIEVDGGGKVFISNADIDPDLPQPGPVSVSYATTVSALGPGDHEICVTAIGQDSSGYASVTQCETIHLLQIGLDPETDTNELGPGQTHTVTATILGPTSGPSSVEGRQVLFYVVSGPNAGKMLMAWTDANGQATFTYPAEQGPAGLGTDTIIACFELQNDDSTMGCAEATKTWVDTTPPEVACVETVNPHGKKVPPAGSTTLPGPKGGQNEDGFYELLAWDVVDPEPAIFVVDTGSGAVFGPFPSGTKVKYTEAAGATPQLKKMGSANGQAGAIDWHIIANGDPCVYAVDFSGNVAECVSCLVPPLPK